MMSNSVLLFTFDPAYSAPAGGGFFFFITIENGKIFKEQILV
jgi:hypothetical protein